MPSTSTSKKESAQLVHEKSFLSREKADHYYARLESELPWGPFSWVPGTKPLKQLVYFYDVQEQHVRPNACLDELIQLVETTYHTKSIVTWCNLFRDSNDLIDWHQDQYGMSLYVLSFGASRPVEIRPYNWSALLTSDGSPTQTLSLAHGDLYHWNKQFDANHQHRVPASGEDGKRISILVLGHPIGSNVNPEKLQTDTMSPVYTGQCNSNNCQGFLGPAKATMTNAERKCQTCGNKYRYDSW
ncbi:expressed unknown protein [Seminavis robusta]|uniref:Fe2OG dioxygenase domain-containing protein n=1 Tax=Seminavis robusta TaxID=568900 RepID=A0A9N8HZ83_9STRA|nr:expressed unknown protein [Seminavis robusta]|eukprot:Sro3312_g346640.1 n/a (243) ;mRNA; r:6091-6819